MVFGEESGEQHPVPVLISAFLHQAIDCLSAGACIAPVAELPGMGTQPPAERALLRAHVLVGFVLVHGEGFEGRPRTTLRHVAGVGDGALETSSG